MIEVDRHYKTLYQSQEVHYLNLLSSPVMDLYTHHGRWVFYTALKTTCDEGNIIQDNLILVGDEDYDNTALNQRLLMPLPGKSLNLKAKTTSTEKSFIANQYKSQCIEELPHTYKDTTISVPRKTDWATDPRIGTNYSKKGARSR